MVPSELIKLQARIISDLKIREWIDLLGKVTNPRSLTFDAGFKDKLNNLVYDTEAAINRLSNENDSKFLLDHWRLTSSFTREALTGVNTLVRNSTDSRAINLNPTFLRNYLDLKEKFDALASSQVALSHFLGHNDAVNKFGFEPIELWILDDNEHAIGTDRFKTIISEIEKIQVYCVQIFGGQNEAITILYSESGSLTKLLVSVLSGTCSFFVGVFTTYFKYIKYDKEIGIEQRSNAILAQISVAQKLEELKKSGAINNDKATLLQTKLVNSVETLIDSGGYIQVPQFTADEQRLLLQPRKDILKLNPATPATEDESENSNP